MLRKLLTGLAAVAIVASVSAKPISPDEALGRLRGSNPKMAAPGRSGKAPRLVHTAKTAKGNPAVYIFNKGENDGYLVLAADDVAYPVLGYSDSGNALEGNLPPQLEWWLSEYARQIEYVNEKGIQGAALEQKVDIRTSLPAIEPMLKTRWDQGEPYNKMCPTSGGNPTYTGCVATAMAQVMNYWKFPEVGKGSISYECEDISKRLSMNFANRKFDWDNMCQTYLPGQYTDAEADAVAYLMKACGYSVRMGYAIDSSGALAMNVAKGLTKYLGYDQNMLYDMRMYYSATEWTQMIYDNLKNVGPVIYGGASMLGGGHSFVCDGYKDGLFHFNWGWSSMSDGYFSLDALNPAALGAGGGSGGGYNFTQDAVFGVQPPTGKPLEVRPTVMTQHGSLSAKVENGTMTFDLSGEGQPMWVNYQPETLKMQFGAIFEPQGATGGETIRKTVSDIKFSIQAGYGTDPAHLLPTIDLSQLALKDGTYKVTFASVEIETGGDDIWEPVRPGYGYVNYVVLKKAGDTYTVENTEAPYIELVDATFLNRLYFGGLANIEITIQNPSDIELTKGFAPALISMDGKLTFLGESLYVTLPPKTDETKKQWTTNLNLLQNIQIQSDTEFYIAFLDEGTGNFYVSEDKIVMSANPGLPKMTVMGTPTLNGTTASETLPNGSSAYVYLINDPTDIQVKTWVTLNSGVFCYNCLAFLVQPDFVSGSGEVEILTMGGTPMFLTPGVRTRFNANLSFVNLQPGQYYAIMMGYEYGQNYVAISGAQPSYFRLNTNSSAVGELESDAEAEENGEIFNLQGISLGNDFDSLPAGLYIRNGKKIIKK